MCVYSFFGSNRLYRYIFITTIFFYQEKETMNISVSVPNNTAATESVDEVVEMETGSTAAAAAAAGPKEVEESEEDVDKDNKVATVNSTTRTGWKHRLLGEYDYKRLCTPRLNPWKKDNQEPLPYYGKDEKLAWVLAAILGFQHSLAVVGGTVIPGILIGNQDPSGQAGPYLVSYALLTSGELTVRLLRNWCLASALSLSYLHTVRPLSVFQVFAPGFKFCIPRSTRPSTIWEVACSVSLPHPLPFYQPPSSPSRP
jgi:hypothetical protein